MKMKLPAVGAMVAVIATSTNAQNRVSNGSFESGDSQGECAWVLHNAGSTGIPGWTVVGGNVDRQRLAPNCGSGFAGWIPYDGEYTVDLNGLASGALQQTLNVIPSQPLRLSFMLTGNCSSAMAGITRSVRVEIAGQSQTFDFLCTDSYPQPWVPCIVDFTPTRSVISLTFTSLTPNTTLGPVIDAVSVGPLPCLADITRNQVVDGVDLAIVLATWGTTGDQGGVNSDVNRDGIVNGVDLAAVLGGWGACP